MISAKSNVDPVQIRQLLVARRGELERRAQAVGRDLGRTAGPLSPDFSEQAGEIQNDDTLAEIGRTATEEMSNIDEALARLAAGKYGECKRCHQPIGSQRLTARPEAVTCTHCGS